MTGSKSQIYNKSRREITQYDSIYTSPAAYEELTELMTRVRRWCLKNNQDWPILFAGVEGSGKSTLALQVAKMLDPDFCLSDSIIFDVVGDHHSYEQFLNRYRGKRGVVSFFDEAVDVFAATEHNTVECRVIQKIFKTKRSYSHFDLIIAPSVWDLVPDIRNRRTKSLIYTFSQRGRKADDVLHMFAYFSAERLTQILQHKNLQLLLRIPEKLFKTVQPNLLGIYPNIDSALDDEYQALKRENQREIELSGFAAIHEKREKRGATRKKADFEQPTPGEFDQFLKQR